MTIQFSLNLIDMDLICKGVVLDFYPHEPEEGSTELIITKVIRDNLVEITYFWRAAKIIDRKESYLEPSKIKAYILKDSLHIVYHPICRYYPDILKLVNSKDMDSKLLGIGIIENY